MADSSQKIILLDDGIHFRIEAILMGFSTRHLTTFPASPSPAVELILPDLFLEPLF